MRTRDVNKIIERYDINTIISRCEQFGSMCKKYRMEKGISLLKMARITGITEVTLRKFEDGYNQNIKYCLYYFDILDVDKKISFIYDLIGIIIKDDKTLLNKININFERNDF